VKGVTIPFKTRLVANCFLTRCTHQTNVAGVLGIDHALVINTFGIH